MLPMTLQLSGDASSIPSRAPHLLLSSKKGNFPSGSSLMVLSVPDPQDPTVSPGEGICSALQLLMLFSCERHPNQSEPASRKYEKLSKWSFSPWGH